MIANSQSLVFSLSDITPRHPDHTYFTYASYSFRLKLTPIPSHSHLGYSLYQRAKQHQQRRAELQANKELPKECSFEPKINRLVVVEAGSSRINLCEKGFKEGQERNTLIFVHD